MKKEIDVDELVLKYEKKQGDYSKDSGIHFRKGIEKALKIFGDRKFNKKDMLNCFNAARKVYTFKNGMPKEVYNSAEGYVDSIEKTK